MKRCCGTCTFFVPDRPLTYAEIRNRVRKEYCRLSNKDTYPAQGKGCLGWKQASQEKLERRAVDD